METGIKISRRKCHTWNRRPRLAYLKLWSFSGAAVMIRLLLSITIVKHFRSKTVHFGANFWWLLAEIPQKTHRCVFHCRLSYRTIARKNPSTGLTCRRVWSAAMPVLFLLSGPKMGFHAAVATRCQISRLSGQKCGNTAPKTVKISIFGQKSVPHGPSWGDSFALFLRNSQRLYASRF